MERARQPAKVYRAVERPDKDALIADLLPQVFQWARTVDAVQPLTSGVWQGAWADPRLRSPIAGIQLDNSDVVSFHSYAGAREFKGRIAELAPLKRPILCAEYLARTLGNNVETILPVAAAHGVAAFNWGLFAGKTQTFLPWDSWDLPRPAPPGEWFSDLLQGDGRPYRDSEVRALRKVTPLLRAK